MEKEDKDLRKHGAEKYTFLKVLFNSVAKMLVEVVMCVYVHKEMSSSILKWTGFRK